MLGFVIAFVVMVVAFGAIVAAFIPIITGVLGLDHPRSHSSAPVPALLALPRVAVQSP